MKYYICKVCGNLITKIEDGGNTPTCCGKLMSELSPASTDGAKEKHIPVCRHSPLSGCSDNIVKIQIQVGSDMHPMSELHYIKWIAIETDKGFHLKQLKPDKSPTATFYLCSEEHVINIYSYCNLHGLWENRGACDET